MGARARPRPPHPRSPHPLARRPAASPAAARRRGGGAAGGGRPRPAGRPLRRRPGRDRHLLDPRRQLRLRAALGARPLDRGAGRLPRARGAAGDRHRQGAAGAGPRALRRRAPRRVVLAALVVANTGTLCAEFAGVAAGDGAARRDEPLPQRAAGGGRRLGAGPARELPPRRALPAGAQLRLRRLHRLRPARPSRLGRRRARGWSCRASR